MVALRSLGLLLAVLPTALLAKIELVVIESRGMNLTPGQTIEGTEPIALKEGQQITLMAEDGRVVKLRGPYEKPPMPTAAATADVQMALRALVTQETQRERSGVIRGGKSLAVPPDSGLVDVTSSGVRCLAAGATVVLWRPDSAAAQPVTLAPADHSWRAQADWAAGADRLALPPEIPVTQRSTLLVRLGQKESVLTLVSLPDSLTNDAMRARYMMEVGCDAQVIALLGKAGLRRP